MHEKDIVMLVGALGEEKHIGNTYFTTLDFRHEGKLYRISGMITRYIDPAAQEADGEEASIVSLAEVDPVNNIARACTSFDGLVKGATARYTRKEYPISLEFVNGVLKDLPPDPEPRSQEFVTYVYGILVQKVH